MGLYKSLFKQTAIYGIATVLPRMLSFLLVSLYTDKLTESVYGEITLVMTYMVFLNVVLAYGMETAFFRFFNGEANKTHVLSTSMMALFWSSMAFLALALITRGELSAFANVDPHLVTYGIWILVLDALVVIPFARLRIMQRPLVYALIKISNVVLNLGLNLFFLLALPELARMNPGSFLDSLYIEGFEAGYILLSNLIASLATFLWLLPDYFRISWQFNSALFRRMLQYSWPILFAGIAFAINEHLDKILLEKLLPKNIAKAEVGIYGACYKLALFMTLYSTAFRLGIEPFFFSHAKNENARQTYADITKYFVIIGSVILLMVIVGADFLKVLLLRKTSYWAAMDVVPLILLANFFLGIYTNLSVWYKLIDKTYIGAYISVIGAIVTLGLNFWLIPHFSYYGSAVATLAAYGTMMLLSWYLGKSRYPIPYDLQRMGAYLGISLLFSSVYFYAFRENYVVGFGLLAAFLYFVYYAEKPDILRLLKRKI